MFTKKQVFVCSGIFNLYISIIKSIQLKKQGITPELIYFNSDDTLKNYKESLLNSNFFNEIIIVPDVRNRKILGIKAIFLNIFQYKKQVNLYFNQYLNKKKLDEIIKDAEVNVFSTTLLFQKYLFFNYPQNYFRIIEDGLIIYRKVKNPITWTIKKLHGVPDRPSDKFFKEILVQRPEELCRATRKKAKKLDLTQLNDSITTIEVMNLKKFFLSGINLNLKNRKTLLIITQPLSEDKYISEEYKINLYKNITAKYLKEGYSIYLKPHPRERTDYYKAMQNQVQIIAKFFPMEILNFQSKIKFEAGITIYSSALQNANFIATKFYLGEKWDPIIYRELKKRFKM